MDDAELQILLKVKQDGTEAFERAKLLAQNLKEAIESLNRATAEGVPVLKAARGALNELSRGLIESDLSARQQKDAINDARSALARYIEVVAAGMAPQDAYLAVLSTQTSAIREQTEAANQNTRATAANSSTKGGFALFGLGPVALGAIASAVALLSPFIALVTAAVVITAAFAVSGAAMVTVLGGMALGFAAIGAGITALGIHSMGGLGSAAALSSAGSQLSTAQRQMFDASQNVKDLQAQIAAQKGPETLVQKQRMEDLLLAQSRAQDKLNGATSAYGGALAANQTPIAQFQQDLSSLVDTLGQTAAPLAAMIINFGDKLLPTIQRIGETMINWFGARLSGALHGLHLVINDLLPTFMRFGRFLGDTFDHVAPQIGPMFEDMARLGIDAVRGLITNLVALSDWFQSRLPVYGPIVREIFGGIGNAVQGAAGKFGQLSDWFAKNWPAIKNEAEQAKNAFAKGWNAIPSLGGPASADPSQVLNELLVIIGIVAHVVVDIVDAAAVITQQAFAALPAALNEISLNFTMFIRGLLMAINALPFGFNFSLPDLPGQGGPAQIGGQAGSQSGDGRHSRGPKYTPPIVIHNHFNGNQNPQLVARTIARNLGRLGAN